MSFDTEVLIIGAGMSGLGLAVQPIRKFGVNGFRMIGKSNDVGGTWLANTYTRCGCDVPIFLVTICSSIITNDILGCFTLLLLFLCSQSWLVSKVLHPT